MHTDPTYKEKATSGMMDTRKMFEKLIYVISALLCVGVKGKLLMMFQLRIGE